MTDYGLDLAVIGNGRTAALLDPSSRIVWWCLPRYDGDPVFCRLLSGNEDKGFTDVVLEGQVETRSDYVRNTAIVVDRTDRQQGRRGAHHRFRAALPDLRPHLPSAATHPHHRADRRHAARHHPLPHDASLWRAGDIAILRQQSHSLLARRGAGAADHRRAALLCRERGVVRVDAAGAHGVRHGRAVRGLARNDLPRFLRPHARLLAGMGEAARLFDRLAGRDHPRRPSRSSCAITRRPARSWRRSPPRFPKGRDRGATGTIDFAGCAMPSSSCARSTASARHARWRISSPTS